jgi:hypothetical protein
MSSLGISWPAPSPECKICIWPIYHQRSALIFFRLYFSCYGLLNPNGQIGGQMWHKFVLDTAAAAATGHHVHAHAALCALSGCREQQGCVLSKRCSKGVLCTQLAHAWQMRTGKDTVDPAIAAALHMTMCPGHCDVTVVLPAVHCRPLAIAGAAHTALSAPRLTRCPGSRLEGHRNRICTATSHAPDHVIHILISAVWRFTTSTARDKHARSSSQHHMFTAGRSSQQIHSARQYHKI